jgi:hypothetical protein
MTDDLKPLPDQEPLRSDWFVEQLGASQQKVMSLTVEKRALEKRLESGRAQGRGPRRAGHGCRGDMQDGVLKSVILERINKVMQKLDGEDQ